MSALVRMLVKVESLNICAGCSIFHHNYKYCLFNCNNIIGPRREKSCLRGFANNKDADQPAHPRRLISAFVIRFLESSISKLATSEHSIFLASLCSWGDLFDFRFVENPEDRFCRIEAHI